MNSSAKHGRIKRWRRPAILLILVATLMFGGLLVNHFRRNLPPTPPAIPEVPVEIRDPEVLGAIMSARKKVEESPESPEAWGRLGKVFLANALSREADVCFRHTEKLDEKNPRWPYYLALANIYVNIDETIACLRRAVERCDHFDPEISSPRLLLATLLIQEGHNAEAGETLRIVRAKEPGNARTIYLTALLLANRNDLRGSAALLRLVSENPAARQKTCTKLAQLHLRLGDTKSAETWDKIARSLPEDTLWPDPYGYELREYLAGRERRVADVTRLEKEGRHDEVVDLLNQMIENNEIPLGQAYVALGNNLVLLGRGREAERAFEEALRLSSNDAETWSRLALVRLFQGEVCENRLKDRAGAKEHYRRALECARTAVKINPLLPQSQLTLGQVLSSLGERQEAITALRACLRLRPEMANAHILLGEALGDDGQLVEARQHLLDAVRHADANDQRAKQALERFEKKHGTSPAPKTGSSGP